MDFSEEAPSPNSAWTARGADYAASEVHQFGPSLPKLLALARPVATDVCLDVGTGSGHTAAQLARFAGRVYGLDPAEGMLEAARQSYGHLANIEFIGGAGDATGFPEATFDLVTARHTLHHHPEIARTLAEIERVLKPGGRFVLVDEVTPNAAVADWYHRLEHTRDPTHIRAYTLTQWRTFIEEAGLMWVVGDAETVYELKVERWIRRTSTDSQQTEAVRQLFREANEPARQAFHIHYDEKDAVTFDMPMALILTVKPEGERA